MSESFVKEIHVEAWRGGLAPLAFVLFDTSPSGSVLHDIAKQHSARFNFFEWGGKDVGGTQRKIGRPDPIFIPIFRETPCVRRSPELGGIYAPYYKLTLAQRNTRDMSECVSSVHRQNFRQLSALKAFQLGVNLYDSPRSSLIRFRH